MGNRFIEWIVDKFIRRFYRITEESIEIGLQDFKTNKNKYSIPKKLKFPREIKCNKYEDMNVFEMPAKQGVDKTIMYIHGGGYINNFSPFHWRFLIDLTKKRGYGLTAPNYPLLPKYTHKKSYEKVLKYYEEFSKKNDMENVVIAGDSAGGGFVLSLVLQLKELNLPLPGKIILISPFVDVEGANKKLAKKDAMVDYSVTLLLGKAWADGEDLKSPVISPLYGDLTNLPPIEIYVGTNEVLYNECIEVYHKLKEAGVDVKINIGRNLGHVYPLYPIPKAVAARKSMIKFIEK